MKEAPRDSLKVVRLKHRRDAAFKLKSEWPPAGDQPAAIAAMVDNLEAGVAHQTLLGVTGSGKTYSIANVIHQVRVKGARLNYFLLRGRIPTTPTTT